LDDEAFESKGRALISLFFDLKDRGEIRIYRNDYLNYLPMDEYKERISYVTMRDSIADPDAPFSPVHSFKELTPVPIEDYQQIWVTYRVFFDKDGLKKSYEWESITVMQASAKGKDLPAFSVKVFGMDELYDEMKPFLFLKYRSIPGKILKSSYIYPMQE
jgi:hypothetical protein